MFHGEVYKPRKKFIATARGQKKGLGCGGLRSDKTPETVDGL